MIITEINGGLGNQMFQYACGRALALLNSTCLRIDNTILKKGITTEYFTARPFELNVFDINAKQASKTEIGKFYPKSIPFKFWYKLLNKHSTYLEKGFNYDEILKTSGKNIFIKGYWQTEKYFKLSESVIREDFNFIAERSSLTNKFENIIQNSNAVSIHIRRGDYISSPTANNFHGVLNLEYYENAIQKITELLENPFYYLFSDDSEWVKNHIVKDREDMIMIEHNKGKDSWQDMYLMSKCKHHIIANSSFSWWGAWLNNSNNKIVISPNQWFKNEEKSKQTQDLIPFSWLKI